MIIPCKALHWAPQTIMLSNGGIMKKRDEKARVREGEGASRKKGSGDKEELREDRLGGSCPQMERE